MRGRLPTPATLADLRGRPGHRSPVTPPPPIATVKVPMPPKGLSRAARRVWKRTISPAIKGGLVDPILDRAVSEIFVGYAAEVIALDKLIRDEGPNVEIALDPALLRTMRARDRCADKVLKYAADLGLTPVGRLRLGHRETAPKPNAEDIRKMLRDQSSATEPTPKATSKTTLH